MLTHKLTSFKGTFYSFQCFGNSKIANIENVSKCVCAITYFNYKNEGEKLYEVLNVKKGKNLLFFWLIQTVLIVPRGMNKMFK